MNQDIKDKLHNKINELSNVTSDAIFVNGAGKIFKKIAELQDLGMVALDEN